MNEKVWLVISGTSYNKKQKVYKTESSLLKAINTNSKSQEIIELSVLSRTNSVDFLKERSRDTQLRSVLGELNSNEESAIKLVTFYKQNAPDGTVYKGTWRNEKETTQKERMLVSMEKFQSDKKAFSNLLISNKKYLLTTLTSVEWYKLILDCHNFNTHVYDVERWTRNEKGERVKVLDDTSTSEMKSNFKEAKLQRKRKK